MDSFGVLHTSNSLFEIRLPLPQLLPQKRITEDRRLFWRAHSLGVDVLTCSQEPHMHIIASLVAFGLVAFLLPLVMLHSPPSSFSATFSHESRILDLAGPTV